MTGITAEANSGSKGNAGSVTVTAGGLTIAGDGGSISSNTFGSGNAGSVSVSVPGGSLTITGTPGGGLTGIASLAETGNTGNAAAPSP